MTIRKLDLAELLEAAKHLSTAERLLLRSALSLTIEEEELLARFDAVVAEIRRRNANYSEEEIAADVEQAIREVREARRRSRRA